MNNPYDIIVSTNDKATSFVQLNEQYNALYNLLVSNQRQISYLDLYKITEYISTEAEGVQIGSKFAQLNPNTAIGIGVPSIKFNGETFYQGDLLLKLSNGQMQKLDAPSHGIYFPRWATEGEIGKKLVWVYSKDEPMDETTSEMTHESKAESLLYWNLPSASTSNGYGQKIPRPTDTEEGSNWTTSINFIERLVPVIKCFKQNNQGNEEILADIEITLTQNNTIKRYTISNIPYCVAYLMVR